jgi:AraC-like DNA-binding protein
MIVSVVGPTRQLPVRKAAAAQHAAMIELPWESVREFVIQSPVEVVVVDPAAVRGDLIHEISAFIRDFPATPVILYTKYTAALPGVLVTLARVGLGDVVVDGMDNPKGQFLYLFRKYRVKSLANPFLTRLNIKQFRPSLTAALEESANSPTSIPSVTGLADRARVAVPTLYRTLQQANWHSPRRFLVACRVLSAYSYLREPGQTVQGVAEKLGYFDPRVLGRHTRAALKCLPHQLGTLYPRQPEQIAVTLADWVHG